MNHLIMTRLLLSVAITVLAIPGFASPLAAKKDGTQVTETPQNGSKVIVVLQEGEVVTSVARKGMFWQVKTEDGREGYVAVTQVQRQTGEAGTVSNAIRRAVADGRDEGDDVTGNRMRTAVMGVRGLSEDKGTASAGNVKPNMRLVYKMEDRWVETQRLNNLENRLQAEIEQRMNLRYGH